jgi:hypothetical protein
MPTESCANCWYPKAKHVVAHAHDGTAVLVCPRSVYEPEKTLHDTTGMISREEAIGLGVDETELDALLRGRTC